MLGLLLLPFTLMMEFFGIMLHLTGSVFRGLFKGMIGFCGLMFSLMFGFWPLMLIGGLVSMVFGILRSLWPLIGVGLVLCLVVWLFRQGVEDGQQNPDDAFARFVNRIRNH